MTVSPATDIENTTASRGDQPTLPEPSRGWRLAAADIYGMILVAVFALLLLMRVWHVNLELGMNPSHAKLVRNAILCGIFIPFILALRLPPFRYRGQLWIFYCAALLLALGWAMRLDIEFKYDHAVSIQQDSGVAAAVSQGNVNTGLTWHDFSTPLLQAIAGFLAVLAGFLAIRWLRTRTSLGYVLLFPAAAIVLLASAWHFDLLHRGSRYQIWLLLLPVMVLGVSLFLTVYVQQAHDVRNRAISRWKSILLFGGVIILPMLTFVAFHELGIYLLILPLVVSMFYLATRRMRYVVLGTIVGACAVYGLHEFYDWGRLQKEDSTFDFYNPAVTKTLGRVHGRLSLFEDFWKGFPDAESADYSKPLIHNKQFRTWMSFRGQEIVSYQAIVRGGYWGLGVGVGNPLILPYATNDQMYSDIAEQLGLAANLLVLLGFIVIGTHAFRVGNLNGQTHFNSLISRSTGVFFLLLWAVGVAGQLNVFLQTGIGIPFVCKSGSMAATGLFMIGVIIGCEASATRQTLQPEEPQPEVNQLLA